MPFYDHYAYRERNKYGEWIKKSFAKKLFNTVTNNQSYLKILELGPGDGYIAELSKENKCDFVGAEGSPLIVYRLKEKGINIVQSLFPPLPKSLGCYDLCFALHLIEHMNSIKEAETLLNDIFSHLSPNGKLIIATPDYQRWRTDFYDSDYTHNLPFTFRRLKQLLVNTNYKIEYANIYVGNAFGNKSLFIYWFVKLFYWRFIDNHTKNYLKSDLWYKGYLTFLPNILMIASKK
jgi:SAM-dependent methyltransferase